MKLKIKILSLVLLLGVVVSTMSSCYLLDPNMFISSSQGGKDTTINTGDINNYDVDINSPDDSSVLSASTALMSVVSVNAVFGRSSASLTGQRAASWGSGVIFRLSEDKSEAYILTNYHVVYNSVISSDIKVYLYGKESYLYEADDSMGCAISAEYVGGSMKYDLAVLKVKDSPVLMESNARACDFADSNNVAVLEEAIAIGNAKGKGISATMGRVNVDSEYISMLGPDDKTQIALRVMRTDAAVNSGNSGGGLFNSKGELIGIVNAKIVDYTVDNIGYAIPSNVAKYIAENIIYYSQKGYSSVYRCILGIKVTVSGLYTEYDTERGLLHRRERVAVETVELDSAVRGILKVGDVINSITIDGKEYEVKRMFHVIDSMLNARADSTVVFNITRGTENHSLTVELSDELLVNADS